MTADEFRRIALSFPGATESAHMQHPDFRAAGKIFATLDYPGEGWAMVSLTPEQQQVFEKKSPSVFTSCAGAWGRRGATSVRLARAGEATVSAAIEAAWRKVNAAKPKKRAS
jgi:hypothetical protein